jgi:endonuclease/exonuclease/phosphatase family metal-dependent hydrolase
MGFIKVLSLFQRVAILFAFVGAMLGMAVSAYSQTGKGSRTVKAMTYNMDEGTDFIEVLSAQNYGEFLAAVQLTWSNVQASNPARRAELLADEIVAAQPDVVSLQEVTTWVTGNWSWSQMTCVPDTVRIDALSLLMEALASRGAHYSILAQVPEFSLGGPFPDQVTCVAAINSDAILGRTAGKNEKLEYSNVQMSHFLYYAQLPSLMGPIDVPRGWASVDVNVAGKPFRFIATHLEDGTSSDQLAFLSSLQAMELLSGPAATQMPVILAGDFNSNANDPNGQSYLSYSVITSGGFSDAWKTAHPDLSGFTWGADGILPNADYVRTQRIDFVLVSGATVLGSKLVGAEPRDRVGDYWPSDHAGVSAHVQLP